MPKNNSRTKHVKTKSRGAYSKCAFLIKGTLIGLSVFAVTLAVGAIIVANKDIDADYYPLILKIIIPVSTFFASFFAGLKSKLKGITAGFLQSVVFLIPVTLLILITNKFNVGWSDMLFVPLSLASGILAGIISANIKR